MDPEKDLGVLDPKVLEYFKFAEFSWWQVVLFFAALAALGAYFLAGVGLHRYSLWRSKNNRERERLERWLDVLDLNPGEQDMLSALAGGGDAQSLYRLLSDPFRFESAIHQAQAEGRYPPFAARMREVLGIHADNPRVRVVSTRQALPGSHFRFSVLSGGRPHSYYGRVSAVAPDNFHVEVTEDALAAIREAETETEMFLLRDNDLEYRFPVKIREVDERGHRLLLAHQMVGKGHRPRGIRLPMVRQMTFAVRTSLLDEPKDGEGLERVPAQQMRGVLLEISEGGFSLVLPRGFQAGCYIAFSLTLSRGRVLPIMGRALESRPFGGTAHLMRCELKGISHERRNLLYQTLRTEQQRRLHQDAKVFGKRRKLSRAPSQ